MIQGLCLWTPASVDAVPTSFPLPLMGRAGLGGRKPGSNGAASQRRDAPRHPPTPPYQKVTPPFGGREGTAGGTLTTALHR
jgi:hypothetical protein